MDLRYAAEAFALVCIAFGLMRWIRRNAAETRPILPVAPRLEALPEGVRAEMCAELEKRGVVSAVALAAMSPKERHLLLTSAAEKMRDPDAPGSRPRSPRLTPARGQPVRPLGTAIYCPSCSAPLSREEMLRYGATTCMRCKRRVSGHVQRNRLTVIVEEGEER